MAGKSIATLGVSLTARLGNFEKGMNKAIKIGRRFSSDMLRHTKTIGTWAAGIASAGVGALSYFTKQQMSAADQSAKVARTLKLSNAELAGYEKSASLAGVSTEELHSAISRMNRTVTGGGSTSERLAMVADRYASLSTATERALYLQKIFGRGAKNIANFLEGGAAGFEEGAKKARDYGLAISEIDSSKIEYANDRVDDFISLIQGAARQIGVNLSPFISAAFEELVNMGTAGETMGEKVTNAFNWVLKAVAKLTDYFELAKAGYYGLQSVILAGAGSIIRVVDMIGRGWTEILNLIPGVQIEFTSFFDSLSNDFMAEARESWENMSTSMGKFLAGVNSKNAEATFKRIQDRADSIAKSSQNVKSDLSEINNINAGKSTLARQVDLSRVSVGGVSTNPQDKGVNRKQGDAMIGLLRSIDQKVGNAAPVVS